MYAVIKKQDFKNKIKEQYSVIWEFERKESNGQTIDYVGVEHSVNLNEKMDKELKTHNWEAFLTNDAFSDWKNLNN